MKLRTDDLLARTLKKNEKMMQRMKHWNWKNWKKLKTFIDFRRDFTPYWFYYEIDEFRSNFLYTCVDWKIIHIFTVIQKILKQKNENYMLKQKKWEKNGDFEKKTNKSVEHDRLNKT